MDQILYIVRMDTFKKPEEPEKNEQAENNEDGNLMKGKRAKISTPGRCDYWGNWLITHW